MSIRETAPVYHGLYTNAFGQRGQGFRHLFLAPEWPPADRRRIGRWLETLGPAANADAGERVAVNSFRIGPTIHACLARVDTDFARDEHGRRGGTLVHALFVPLAEGRPPGTFTASLYAMTRRFVRPETVDEDRLEAYLVQCRGAREVAAPPVPPETLRHLGDDLLVRFCALAAAPPRSKDAVFAPADGSLAGALSIAAGILPPRLRLACRWAVGLRPTSEMSFVARTAADGESPPPLSAGTGSVYARWLRDHDTGPAESWEIRSWDGLMEWIRRRS